MSDNFLKRMLNKEQYSAMTTCDRIGHSWYGEEDDPNAWCRCCGWERKNVNVSAGGLRPDPEAEDEQN